MPYKYNYKAVSYESRIQTGVIEADDIKSARQALDSQGFIPLDVKLKSESGLNFKGLFKPSIKLDLIAQFTQKFKTLYRSGLPILQALDIIARDISDQKFGEVLKEIRHNIEGGMTLSQAMEQFPDFFPSLYVNTVRAGESSGQLESILDRLYELIEREKKTKEMIKSSVRYPAYVMVTISLAIMIVVIFVVPKFADFYGFYKAQLPLPTLILINFSNYIYSSWYIVIAAGLLLAFAFYNLKKISGVARFIDRIKIEFPIIGELFLLMIISRTCYLLSTLIKSGLPLVNALYLVGKASGNSIIADIINKMAKNTQSGGDILKPMRESKYFLSMVVEMINIGLESGHLDDMLSEIARHYDDVVEYRARKLTTRIEPILTVFVAGIVLFLALAIFLPMWNLIQVFKK
jgi:MSHA biogenesis protein MshG